MSDYLFLFRGGFPTYEGWSPEEMQQHFKKWGAWIKRMSEDGHYQAGHPLAAEGKTVTGTGKVVKDGPFAEAKDVVGGYVLISSETPERALELAKECPVLEIGGQVEVRPISTLHD